MHHFSRFLAFLPKGAWGKPVIGVRPLWFTTLAALALLLSSCATGATSTVTTLTLTTSRQTASATLLHSPTGIVILHWVHKPQVLLVTIGVNGLAPKSLHPIHL